MACSHHTNPINGFLQNGMFWDFIENAQRQLYLYVYNSFTDDRL